MSIETLFNQPFKKKIKIVHNKFKNNFLKRFQKERIEINFSFLSFLIFQNYLKNKNFKIICGELIEYTVSHWSCIDKLSKMIF